MSTPGKEQLEEAIQSIAGQAAREMDEKAWHRLTGCVAVARLVFGAYLTKQITEERLKDAVKDLIEVSTRRPERRPEQAIALDIDEYIRGVKPVLDRKKPLESLRDRLGEQYVLVIDDEWDEVGWHILFDTLFGKDRTFYAKNREKGLQLLEARVDCMGLVFLDLLLPSSPEEGLRLLKEIKELSLDLPVVVFTGHETARYVKRCFKEGAFEYFVKELRPGDRDPVDYFLKFRGVCTDALAHQRRREIWQSLRDFKIQRKREGPPYYHEIDHYLQKAYYFLVTDDDSWSHRMLLSGLHMTPYGEVVTQCAVALEWIADKVLEDRKNDPKLKVKGPLGDMMLGQKINCLRELGILDSDQQDTCKKVNALRTRSVHPSRKGQTVTEAEAVEAVGQTLKVLKGVFGHILHPPSSGSS